MTVKDSTRVPAVPPLPDEATIASFIVRPDEEPWTLEEISGVVEELSHDIARLTTELAAADAELTELLRNSGDGAGDDQADSGSSAVEREQELTLVNNMRELLEQSLHALGRLKTPSFGLCDLCGEPIGKLRVQAYPRATLCVACKQREERR